MFSQSTLHLDCKHHLHRHLDLIWCRFLNHASVIWHVLPNPLGRSGPNYGMACISTINSMMIHTIKRMLQEQKKQLSVHMWLDGNKLGKFKLAKFSFEIKKTVHIRQKIGEDAFSRIKSRWQSSLIIESDNSIMRVTVAGALDSSWNWCSCLREIENSLEKESDFFQHDFR